MSKEAVRRLPLKEQPLRMPGQGLDERLKTLAFDKAIPLLLAMSFICGLTLGAAVNQLFGRYLSSWLLLAICLGVTAYGWFEVNRFARKAVNIKLGRAGERHVAQILQSLDLSGARLFHDIPAGNFNLDHVLVCDRGIYVIETKTWRKPLKAELEVRGNQIFINGRPASGNAIGQAAGAARWLSEMLHADTGHPHRCQPVVAVPGWYVGRQDAESKALAWVLEPKALAGWIRRDPAALDQAAIRRIEGAIAKYVRSQMPPLDTDLSIG